MAGLGFALKALNKISCVAAAENRTVNPPRKIITHGIVNPSLRYVGTYTVSDRYYFAEHPTNHFITGPSAGHGIEGEILRRVAQHPSDPLGLRNLGIDNTTWIPNHEDILDMAYVEWSRNTSLYSEIDRPGGMLDRLGLRDVPVTPTTPAIPSTPTPVPPSTSPSTPSTPPSLPSSPPPSSGLDPTSAVIADLRQQLERETLRADAAVKSELSLRARLQAILSKHRPPTRGGGAPTSKWRDIWNAIMAEVEKTK